MKVARRGTIYLLIALAGFLMTTPVALYCFRGLDDVSPSPAANVVISVSSGMVTAWPPASAHSLGSKDIEAAERINAEMMRRSREEWERAFPLRESGK